MKIEVGKTYKVLDGVDGYEEGEVFEVEGFSKDGRSVDLIFYNDTRVQEDYLVLRSLNLMDITSPKRESSKPAHYDTAIDTIAFAKANFSREAVEGFMRINALKYIQRYDKKNGADDIRKAIVYLNMLLEHVEEEGK